MRRPDLGSLAGRRVLVTGAASGIGRALAFAAAADGAEVYLSDIDADGLAGTAAEVRRRGGRVGLAEPADVSSHEQVRALAERVAAALPPGAASVDVVCNVAGIAIWGTVENLTHDQWRRCVEVNLMGPIHVLECFVPAMVAAGRGGHVVTVSSAAGLIGLPWHAAYSAAKFGVRGISEVLRFELRPHGIGVSLVCPGAVDTGLAATVQIAGVDLASERFGRLRARFRAHAVRPDAVAARILRGIARNQYLVYTSWDVRAAHALQRTCPPLYRLIMRVVHRIANRMLPMPTKAPR